MVRSIKTGWFAPGEYTEKVEEGLEDYLNIRNVALTNSCTSALHASLIMAGVGKGDEVITTPMSWVATANVIRYVGAKPVFVDVDQTGCIDPRKVRPTKKTKAIIAVHYCGQLADIPALKDFGVPVIEDAAHCLMKGVGEGDYTCFSFHAAKNLTCGNGGAIASNHPIDRRLLYHGVEKIDGKRVMTGFGFKGQITDFQAALLLGQIKRIDKTQKQRERVFKRYLKAFDCHPAQERPHAYHMFVIFTKDRDAIREELLEKGIETSIHYSPIHLEPYYLGFKTGSFPIAEKIGREVITLPTYNLTKKQQDYVIKEVAKCLESH